MCKIGPDFYRLFIGEVFQRFLDLFPLIKTYLLKKKLKITQ